MLKTLIISGKNYEAGYWTVDQALEVLTWLVKTLGEPVATLLVEGGAAALAATEKPGKLVVDTKTASVLDFDIEEMKPAISGSMKALVHSLNDVEIKKFMRLICGGQEESQLLCEGKRINYDSHYAGKIGHLFTVFVYVLRFQYEDFFSVVGLRDMVSGAMEAKEKATTPDP